MKGHERIWIKSTKPTGIPTTVRVAGHALVVVIEICASVRFVLDRRNTAHTDLGQMFKQNIISSW